MLNDLMGLAIGLHFKLTSKLLPFPYWWDKQRSQLKYSKFVPRFTPWYCIAFILLPLTILICIGILLYDIIQPERILNFFQLLVSIWTIVVCSASAICAANLVRYSEEWVECFNQFFYLRNTRVKKGTDKKVVDDGVESD
jgi:hypothetical protein